jgi:uncharacterized protein involved in exopolysaccharide biosynthesis
MSWLIHFIARFYPRSWRERYGAEFAALLEDVRPDGRRAANVLAGAFAMHIRAWKSWKILAASALVGVAFVAGFFAAFPKTHASNAVLTGWWGTGRPGDAVDAINSMLAIIESRDRLTQVITTYGLYRNERSRRPLEDVIDDMRKQIRLGLLNYASFQVGFSYDDPRVAQQVAQAIASQFLAESRQSQGFTLQILDNASLPKTPIWPNEPLVIGFGISSFLLMWGGLSVARSVSEHRCATAGLSISSGVTHSRVNRNLWKILAAFSLLTAVAALSYYLANPSYQSTAVIRILQVNPDYLASLTQSIKDRFTLTRIIADDGLYQSEYHPEGAIQQMKEHLRIEPLGRNSAIGVRFAYGAYTLTPAGRAYLKDQLENLEKVVKAGLRRLRHA